MTQGLIEPQRHVPTKAADHRGAGDGCELSDPVDSESVQGAELVGRKPQSPDRQGCNHIYHSTCRHDSAGSEARHGPSGARGVGDGRSRRDALAQEAVRQILEQIFFAAEEMRYSRNINPETIGGIGSDHGRVANGPTGHLPQRCLILVRRRIDDMELRRQGLGLGERHAGVEAEVLSSGAGRAQDAARSDSVNGHERLIARRLP
jgi:hypothetical protein